MFHRENATPSDERQSLSGIITVRRKSAAVHVAHVSLYLEGIWPSIFLQFEDFFGLTSPDKAKEDYWAHNIYQKIFRGAARKLEYLMMTNSGYHKGAL